MAAALDELQGSGTHGARLSAWHIEQAMRNLHPCCRDPEACAEYDARKRGEYSENAVPSRPDRRDAIIAALTERLEALEKRTPSEHDGARSE